MKLEFLQMFDLYKEAATACLLKITSSIKAKQTRFMSIDTKKF